MQTLLCVLVLSSLALGDYAPQKPPPPKDPLIVCSQLCITSPQVAELWKCQCPPKSTVSVPTPPPTTPPTTTPPTPITTTTPKGCAGGGGGKPTSDIKEKIKKFWEKLLAEWKKKIQEAAEKIKKKHKKCKNGTISHDDIEITTVPDDASSTTDLETSTANVNEVSTTVSL